MPKRIALHLPNAPLGRYGCYCIWFPYGGYLVPDYMWGSVFNGFFIPDYIQYFRFGWFCVQFHAAGCFKGSLHLITYNTLGLGSFTPHYVY